MKDRNSILPSLSDQQMGLTQTDLHEMIQFLWKNLIINVIEISHSSVKLSQSSFLPVAYFLESRELGENRFKI